ARSPAGRPFVVQADIFSDGHEVIRAALLWWREGGTPNETEMEYLVNDRWTAGFTPDVPGLWRYSLLGWRDEFATWRRDTAKKIAAGQDVTVEAEEGRLLVAAAAGAAAGDDRAALEALAGRAADPAGRTDALMDPQALALMTRAGPRANQTRLDRDLTVVVDTEAAVFSAW